MVIFLFILEPMVWSYWTLGEDVDDVPVYDESAWKGIRKWCRKGILVFYQRES